MSCRIASGQRKRELPLERRKGKTGNGDVQTGSGGWGILRGRGHGHGLADGRSQRGAIDAIRIDRAKRGIPA